MASRSFKVVWLGSFSVLKEALDVHVDDDVDYATRAAWLQTSLIPHIPGCKWHGSVRAFAGFDGPELTLKPIAWSQYFAAFDANGSGSFESEQSVVAGAWTYLKAHDGTIVVTRYRYDESFIGQIKTLDNYEEVRDLWDMLPVNVRTQAHVLKALAAHQCDFHAMPPQAWKIAEVHYAYASRKCSRFGHAPASLRQSRDFVLRVTGLLYPDYPIVHSWNYNDGNNAPPHISGSALSDCFHDTLSPGTYTRDDVLRRARECGDVVLLHGKAWLNDLEVVQAALESGCFINLLSRLPGALRDNKEIILKIVSHNGRDVRYASDRLKADFDVCTAACINSCDAFQSFTSSEIDAIRPLWPRSPLIRTCASLASKSSDPFSMDRAVLLQLIKKNKYLVRDLMSFGGARWLFDDSFVHDCVRANWLTAAYLKVYLASHKGQYSEAFCERAFAAHFKNARWAMKFAIDATNLFVKARMGAALYAQMMLHLP